MAQALTSMKLPPPKPEAPRPETVLASGPEYPWGLCIRLEDKSLEALGITKLPSVGDELMVTAKVKVTSVRESEYQREGGTAEVDRCVELQITDMGLGKVEAEKDAAGALYGSKA